MEYGEPRHATNQNIRGPARADTGAFQTGRNPLNLFDRLVPRCTVLAWRDRPVTIRSKTADVESIIQNCLWYRRISFVHVDKTCSLVPRRAAAAVVAAVYLAESS